MKGLAGFLYEFLLWSCKIFILICLCFYGSLGFGVYFVVFIFLFRFCKFGFFLERRRGRGKNVGGLFCFVGLWLI